MLLSRMKVKDGRLVTKDFERTGAKIVFEKEGYTVRLGEKGSDEGWFFVTGHGEDEIFRTESGAKQYINFLISHKNTDSITEGSKIVVNTENHVNESAIAVSVNEDNCLVRFENGDEETVPIEAVSAFESMANDESSEETESQIAELTKNMDAARARGYDISAYQKEIARLKSVDALNAKMKLSQSAAIAMIQKMYPNTQYSEDNRGSLIFAFNGNIVGQYDIETKTLYYQFKSSQDKYTGDPLTEKGKEVMAALKEQYGEEKGEQVFYAMKNSGQIEGIDSKTTKDREYKTIAVSGPGVERETVEIAVDVSPRWGKIYRIRRIPNVPDMLIDKDTGWNDLGKLKSEALRIIRSTYLSRLKVKDGRVVVKNKDIESIIPSGTLVRYRFSSVNPYIWFEGKIIKYKKDSKEYWVESLNSGQDCLVQQFDIKRK